MTSKAFIVAGIKNLLKRNYGINPETVDLEAHVDSTLSFGENWTEIKEMVLGNNLKFDYLTCEKCAFKIRENWHYCPNCGGSI